MENSDSYNIPALYSHARKIIFINKSKMDYNFTKGTSRHHICSQTVNVRNSGTAYRYINDFGALHLKNLLFKKKQY